MKKVLIIIEKFYPQTTAITNCLESIFIEMKNQKIDIDVITYKQDKTLKNKEIINGINIYRINDYYNIYKSACLKKIILRIYRKLFLKHKFIKEGKKLLKLNNYDCVIACSYPFLMEEMASKIVEKTCIPFISYQFDPYYNNKILDSKDKEKRLIKELNVLNNAKVVFLPKENYEENIKSELIKLKDKYYPIELALVKEWNKYDSVFSSKAINFVYTGTFYKNIREPNQMLDFFTKLDINFKLYIYCIADDDIKIILNSYKEILKDRLIIKYNQNKELCNQALYSADFVINIGNVITNQIPSKIYELISLGKPIINFYTVKNDSSKEILKKYSLCIHLKRPFSNELIDSFKKFCTENKDKKYSFYDITKIYKSAADVSKEFIKKLGEVCEK